MLIRSLPTAKVHLYRRFSSLASHMLKTGDILRQTRIFSEKDVLEYSNVSHDLNSLHFDSETARNAGFGDPLVHGLLVASLFPHVISLHFPGAVYASQSLNFKSPIYIGDEIIGEVEATNIREFKSRYLAKFKTRCLKNGEIAIDGEAVAILPTLLWSIRTP